MSAYVTGLFVAIFGVCCALALWYGGRLHVMLAARHRPAWRDVQRRYWFDPMLSLFAWTSEARKLADPELHKVIRKYRTVQVTALAAWVALAVMLLGRPGS